MNSNWRGKDLDAIISLRDFTKEEIIRTIFPRLNDFLADSNCLQYGYIIHDSDLKDEETIKKEQRLGIVDPDSYKTIHIHLVAEFPSKLRGRQMTAWINKMADFLKVKPTAITLEKLSSFEGAFQYLIHKNNPEKFQYPKEEIRSNLTEKDVELILTMEVKPFSFDYVCQAVDRSSNLRELVANVGFKVYIGYRNVILDLWRDKIQTFGDPRAPRQGKAPDEQETEW